MWHQQLVPSAGDCLPPFTCLHDAILSFDLCRCREMLRNSPMALRVLKSALNAAEDGQAGIQQLGGDATLLFYQSEEGNEVSWGGGGDLVGSWKRRPSSAAACSLIILLNLAVPCHGLLVQVNLWGGCNACYHVQGRQAYMEQRAPDFSRFKRLP